MTLTSRSIEDLTLNITQEVHVRAPLDKTFAAILDQLGPHNEKAAGELMPMKLEAWPGGRWFRDLGGEDGHFWGHVQAIKRPHLLEITGPLFASYPFVSNVQYRLKPVDGGTLISFRHTALGFIQDEHKAGVGGGWAAILDRGSYSRRVAPEEFMCTVCLATAALIAGKATSAGGLVAVVIKKVTNKIHEPSKPKENHDGQ